MRQLLLVSIFSVAVTGFASADEWKELFNGKDLTGWKGKSDLWSVKDGAITGYTKDGKIPGGNSFLVWDGKVADFELKVKYKIVGGNSGIQYRSKHVGKNEDYVVGGYQADIDSAKNGMGFVGILYEERGRGVLCNRGTKTWIDPTGKRFEKRESDAGKMLEGIKKDDWNEYVVIAKANHLVHKINGKVTAETIDFQKEKRAAEGLLAFQIHAGMGEMTVQFKEIQLKELKGCEEVTTEKSPIPADAVDLSPKPKKK